MKRSVFNATLAGAAATAAPGCNGDTLTEVSANLALFRVQEQGKVEFVRIYDIDVAGEMIWWMGVVG